jgi:hypothetical protein
MKQVPYAPAVHVRHQGRQRGEGCRGGRGGAAQTLAVLLLACANVTGRPACSRCQSSVAQFLQLMDCWGAGFDNISIDKVRKRDGGREGS